MTVLQQINQLMAGSNGNRIRCDEPMSQHTTFRIGGPADIFVSPASTEELQQIVALCRSTKTPWTVIGKGSNILVSDRGIRGVVIEIADGFSTISFSTTKNGRTVVRAMAGARLSS